MTTPDDFLIFGAPAIEQPEIDEVLAVMESGWLGTGPKVAQFERDFSSYKGAEHVAAVNSCTAALHLSILAAGIKPGDEVITTPMTFCATVNAIIHAGGLPVLADVDPLTMNIDPERVREKITSRTRAILPVHFAGRPCDMESLCAIAEERELMIIEDCAHAIETEYRGKKAGTIGNFGCFSFYVTKNVVTGEGGMVLARNEGDIARIKVLGLHGMSKDAWKRFSDEGYKHYQVVDCGFKYNMMDLQAAIGIHQLARVERNWERRREVWQTYQSAFAELPVTRPAEPESSTRHAYHLYTILIDDRRCGITRDQFLDAMTARNIGVGVHYLSIPEHHYYRETFGWRPEDYPNAMRLGRETVSLPISARLEKSDVARVVEAVKDSLTARGKKP
ncbi:MAG: DegT/DnrJ/EryC1/StrS family aminotransferase [Burkholderiales bacterium]|nr:DegT/DnrJ/EryC1/StrS family aminotransferase [Burkholderiales bacterium]